MSVRLRSTDCMTLIALGLALDLSGATGGIRLVSQREPTQALPAGGNGDSCLPVLSGDGRYVLFASTAENLVRMNNGLAMSSQVRAFFNVFRRDRLQEATELIGVNQGGTGCGNGDSFADGASSDGRLVLFKSSASNLVVADTNGVSDISLRDLAEGTTRSVSLSTNEACGNGPSCNAVMTPDGRYVAFVSEASSHAFQCLNNTRQLNRAWRMWSADNQDLLLYAAVNSSDPQTLFRTWVMTDWDWEGRRPWDPTLTVMKSPMWPYCGTNLNIWRCPSDWAKFWVNRVPRRYARTYRMNVYLGGWGRTISDYRLHLELSEINDPVPARMFVFIDSRPDSIKEACFVSSVVRDAPRNPSAYRFWDLPGASRNGAASVSFADGHGELHWWLDRRTTPGASIREPIYVFESPENPDVAWLQDHATRPR